MLGYKLSEDILELLNKNDKVFIYQKEGKAFPSETLDNETIGVIFKQKDCDVNTLSEDKRCLINSKNLLAMTVGTSVDNSEIFFPDRYFENTPFVGRPFLHGMFDCFTLLKDYYKRNFNILLPQNLQRNWEWWTQGENLYVDNAAKYNFEVVKDIKKHDIILMKFNSQVPNHGAIYLGNNKILHHMAGKFSTIEELTTSFKFKISTIYRNKDLVNAN